MFVIPTFKTDNIFLSNKFPIRSITQDIFAYVLLK